jgi:hypothetical protein
MGTYDDESPDASITDRIANSVRKTVADVAQLASPRSVAAAKPREDQNESTAEGNDANTASNAGSSAQSTDSWNKY